MDDTKQEKIKKVLKKAVDIKKNSDLAMAREFIDLDEKIEKITEEIDEKLEEIKVELKKKDELEYVYEINKEELKGDKGEKGDKGDKGEKGDTKIIEKVIEKREIVKEQPIIYKNVTNEIKEIAKYEERGQIINKINSGKEKDVKIEAKQITGLPEFTREVVREVGSVGHIETPLKAGTNITITTDGTGAKVISYTGGIPDLSGYIQETFETVSKNLKSYPYALNYTGSQLTSIVYTLPSGTITKTLNYTGSQLTSMVLSGSTPSGITLTKTLGYTGSTLTSITYS